MLLDMTSTSAVRSLLDESQRTHTLERIAGLRSDARPAWGKLSVAGMLVHVQRPFLVAFGELEIPRNMMGRLFGGYAKRKYIVGGAPTPKNLPTEKRFLEPSPGPFEQERARLVELVGRFAEPGAIRVSLHPFFGPMSEHEWGLLMAQHLDHHLGQFGA